MPCYHPLIRIKNLNKPTKALDGHIYYKASIEQPDDINLRLEELKASAITDYQVIPCKKCIGCRLEYSREWANRGYLEAKLWKQNWFVTLTYDEENIKYNEEITTSQGITYTSEEWKGTLDTADLEKFLHNLRQYMSRKGIQKDGIRYMACGEYGEERERPHYHLILFNCNLPQESFYKPRIINHETYWQNKIIEKCWKHGISNISEASWNNIAYCSRYITKKITGKQSEEYYAEKGQIKEFFRTSRMPGIGKGYYDKYKDKIYKNDEIIIHNKTGTIATKPPKYFDKLYEAENPKAMEKIKRKRQRQQLHNNRLKDTKTSKTRLQQLAVEESYKADETMKLRRSYEKKEKK